MRIRKNINCLSKNELHDLREAFAGIYQLPDSNPSSFAQIAGLHGLPLPYYCKHGEPGFLTWHRAYLLELENALRKIRCNVTLPYWNWSTGNTTGLPTAFRDPTYQDRNGNTVANPLYAGPKPPSIGGGMTQRRADIDTTLFGDLATQAQTAMTATTWGSFISQLDNVHGAIHGRISGDMGSVSTAGYDPIFYFHHCNVDRLGAIWQGKNPGQFPSSEASVDLKPFTQPYTTNWYKGAGFEHINALDYKYQNWCFILPHWPIEVFEFPRKPFPFPLDKLQGFDGPVRLHLERAMMPEASVEIRVFINAPDANEKTPIIDNPNFAGTFGVFGMGKMPMEGGMRGSIDLSLDITDTLKSIVTKRSKEVSLMLVPIFTTELKLTKAEKIMQGAYHLTVEVE